MFFEEEKRYVRADDPHNPFNGGIALWINCWRCGAALLIPPGAAAFCTGHAGGCGEVAAREMN